MILVPLRGYGTLQLPSSVACATDCWLERCVQDHKWHPLSSHFTYRPITVRGVGEGNGL